MSLFKMKCVKNFYGLFLMILSVFWVSLCFGESPVTRFHQAEGFYKKGDYDQAIVLYESILKENLVSGPVYYNLGNSYFKKNQLGKAILNYKRAKLLMPRDPDLKANYQFALERLKTYEVQSNNLFKRMIELYSNFWTLNELTWLLFVCFFLAGIIYYLGLFLRLSYKPILLGLVISVFLLFFHGGIFLYQLNQYKQSAIVLASKLGAQFEPVDSATVHFELTEGQEVKLLEQEGDWIKIKRTDGKLGWIKKEFVEKI